MVYPVSRSMNADLAEGLTDGKYKKFAPNRGGVVSGTTEKERADLEPLYYGFKEKVLKVAPDGLAHPGAAR